MKPPPHALLLLRRSSPLLTPPPKRPFITNPLTPPPQTHHATLTLSHPASALYALILDIPSYPLFLPHLTSSTITAHSPPHPTTHTTYPTAATLHIAWGPYAETFSSRIFCSPPSILEAISGPGARTALTAAQLPHHPPASLAETVDNSVFESLVTRWTLTEYPFKPPPPREGAPAGKSKPQTEVHLNIEVRFKSAVYAALSQAAAPRVAGILVQAFERRAREVLGEGEGGPEECRMEAEGKEEGEKSGVGRSGS